MYGIDEYHAVIQNFFFCFAVFKLFLFAWGIETVSGI